jgi:hypothetical protein
VSAVAITWFVVGIVSTAAIIAVLIGLVRHALVLSRALRRFQREVTPLTQEISQLGERASSRAGAAAERPFGRRTGRAVR